MKGEVSCNKSHYLELLADPPIKQVETSISKYFAHLEHVGSENLNVVLPELSQDDFAELGEEYHSVPENVQFNLVGDDTYSV